MQNEKYDPISIEKKWQKNWEQGNKFQPTDSDENFSIVIPPPNVTGSLHMGHALEHSIIDVITRRKRLQGFQTLWLPGTDHAGIITQLLVEKELEENGISKHDLGRENFLAKVWEWKEKSGDNITNQMKTLGMSCDWSRERFTMDEGLSQAVINVFVSLYENDLIYKGTRMVNWDTKLKSAVSDLEVTSSNELGKLWTINYKVGDSFIEIATTRPETLLGDTAVAVNPSDDRYKDLIGKTAIIPVVNREVEIIADDYVDVEFGSGCVKITPAHDFNDYEIGKRHNLEMIRCLDFDGKIENHNFIPKELRGLDRFEAREKIIDMLKNQNLLKRVEDHQIQIPKGDRSKTILEPMVSEQWFVKTYEVAKKAIQVVEDDEIRFIPKNWEKTYFEWMYNIQDWCISRQQWWGHRIPAWYDDEKNHYVGTSEVNVREKYGLKDNVELIQDEDVLDTWFSSALWPFSTLGWPEDTEDLKSYYPTTLLVTGFDIIFFWVARMIMMGLYTTENIPFKDILIHGLVRDSQGRKMSKSLGNTMDPLELSEKHGADALRFSLIEKANPGQDVPFDEEWTVSAKKFGNKIWNAAKFVHLYTDESTPSEISTVSLIENKWIISRFNETLGEINELFEKYKISDAYKLLYNFLWSELFDWYFEFSKNLFIDEDKKFETQTVLKSIFLDSLKLLNPAMPHITEEIWSSFNEYYIIDSSWPTRYQQELVDIFEIDNLREIITKIRNFKSTYNLKNSLIIDLYSAASYPDWFINQLEKTASVNVSIAENNIKEGVVLTFQSNKFEFSTLANKYIDVANEIKRLNKKIKELSKSLEISNQRLNNDKFINNAKQELIDHEKQNVQTLNSQIDSMNSTLKSLDN
ncbi:MAG: valine--tRNA ligase [Actinomycetota bacterium]|nr:valine--tRNA ligase [Actinomycetota bacterium]